MGPQGQQLRDEANRGLKGPILSHIGHDRKLGHIFIDPEGGGAKFEVITPLTVCENL